MAASEKSSSAAGERVVGDMPRWWKGEEFLDDELKSRWSQGGSSV
jgi:hypothetical protein